MTAKTGKSARNKGAAAERELAAMLSDQLGIVVKRKLGQARDGGDDIQIGQFRIEVKRRERLAIEQWCKQVEAASGPENVPIVAFRRSGEPWRAVVPMSWLIFAIREQVKNDEPNQ
jgi:Holliday junction resolvase